MQATVGKILISEPFLADPNFNRTVVLITEATEEGTVGYVLNQATKLKVSDVIEELQFVTEKVYKGGPVGLDSFHFIHTYSSVLGSVEIGPGLFWGGDFDSVISSLKDGRLDASKFKFFVGYSGWSKGQLERELMEKAWIVNTLDQEVILDHTIEDSELWKHAVRSIDGDDSLLANSPSYPQLN